ncbi:MAG: hypothetical protein KDC38_07375 [Planctomycetes bacterium]|nr:hypothetical protein [Planctomycetota bacterium]
MTPLLSLIAATLLSLGDVDSTELRSGLQPGETAGAFYVDDVTGPRAGSSLCYACAFAKRTVINIQTRKLTAELGQLLRSIDRSVSSASKMTADSKHAFLVYLTDDPDTAEAELVAFAKKHTLVNIPLTLYDDPTGPPDYKISPKAETTVLMWSNTEVKANHAFAPGKFDVGAVAEVWGRARQHLGIPDERIELRSLGQIDEELGKLVGKVVILDLWALW